MLKKAKNTFLEGVNRWLFTGLLIIAVTAISFSAVPSRICQGCPYTAVFSVVIVSIYDSFTITVLLYRTGI